MNLCLIFGIIFLVNCSTAQYSYVYEIRHENKHPKNEDFGELSQYKYSSPSELPRPEASTVPDKTPRDFAVKSPQVGPDLLNILRGQLQDKKMEPKDSLWSSPPDTKYAQSSPLVLQSNTDYPTYARQPSPKSYASGNELPLHADKYRMPAVPKGYPIMESRPLKEEPRLHREEPRLFREEPRLLREEPRLLREEPRLLREEPRLLREEPKIYEQRPVYTTTYPTPTHSSRSQPQQQEKDEKLRTVHQIQTPNYRISLVSKPESLDKLLPLIEQYQLSNKPFQSNSPQKPYPQPSPISSHSGEPSSYRPDKESYRPDKEMSGKPLFLSVDPEGQIIEPYKHSVSEIRDNRPSHSSLSSARPISQSMYDDRVRESLKPFTPSPPMRQYPEELKSEPRPILDLPRQELPPQMQQLKGRPVSQSSAEIRGHPMIQSRPQSYSKRPEPELIPVTALYQMTAPDLKNTPKYSRVEYASEEDPKREGRRQERPITYSEEPAVYRVLDRSQQRPDKEMPLTDLNEQLAKLRDDSAQKSFFDQLKSQSLEMSDRSRTKYRKDDQPLIASDPNYKPSPIPEEYKPFTQTRYFKTYV